MSVLNLTTKRFERLERAQRETNERLGRLEETFTRAANTLDVHSDHFARLEEAMLGISAGVDRMNGRIDLLVGAIARNRTQDLARFDHQERRLSALERKRRARRPR